MLCLVLCAKMCSSKLETGVLAWLMSRRRYGAWEKATSVSPCLQQAESRAAGCTCFFACLAFLCFGSGDSAGGTAAFAMDEACSGTGAGTKPSKPPRWLPENASRSTPGGGVSVLAETSVAGGAGAGALSSSSASAGLEATAGVAATATTPE